MYRQEEIKPYGDHGDKETQVERMFDTIAPTYDRLNHQMSWNIDKVWRSKSLNAIAPYEPRNILDVATGTGDFAIEAAMRLNPDTVTATDISEGMMDVGKRKVKECGLDGIISFKKEDCMNLSFSDNTFDAVTAAFGIRNFPSLDKGLREMGRVLKPGGHLCIAELTTPVSFPMRQLFWVYSHTMLPLVGWVVSKDRSAYSYLTATIEAFPQGEEMIKILKRAGFNNACFQRLTAGICTLYIATK